MEGNCIKLKMYVVFPRELCKEIFKCTTANKPTVEIKWNHNKNNPKEDKKIDLKERRDGTKYKMNSKTGKYLKSHPNCKLRSWLATVSWIFV